MCLHIGLEENASFQPELSLYMLIFSYRGSMKPLGYVFFVLPPLKRNVTDKEELNFEVICFVFLKYHLGV
jgi:hypothetical protein